MIISSLRSLVPCVLATVVAVPWSVSAQERPNYSGTWTAATDPAPPAGTQPVRLFGQEFVIRHEGQTLAITRSLGAASMTTAHVLDGSETRTRRPGRLCEADSELLHVASWDGAAVRIMMIGAAPPGGGDVIKREVKWMVRMQSPDSLLVEIVPSPDAPPAAKPASTVYKRTAAAPAAPPKADAPKVRASIGQVSSWLAGVWVGTMGSSSIEERWTPPAGGSMLAISRTIRNGVMNAFEFLCIVEREGGLVYTAMPNGRQPATDFALTRIDGESVTFENPTHDFPKMIRYTRKADETLEAVVSGDAKQKPQTFLFKKQE